MEKYHKTDIAPVEQENERDETYQASNPQIDKTRTGGNYHIVKRQRSYTQFINDKIEALDLPTKVRKDAVLMCSFVVGSDRKFFGELSPSEQQQFFAECTRFFADRYSEENIISAVVHMDETTPHLHLNLIPIADGRLCAKRATAILCGLHPLLRGALRRGQYHFCRRPHGRNHAALALEFDPDSGRQAVREEAV